LVTSVRDVFVSTNLFQNGIVWFNCRGTLGIDLFCQMDKVCGIVSTPRLGQASMPLLKLVHGLESNKSNRDRPIARTILHADLVENYFGFHGNGKINWQDQFQ
jgi:hypothetical protein